MNFNQTMPRAQAPKRAFDSDAEAAYPLFCLRFYRPSRFPFARRTQDNDKTETNNECYNK